MPIDRPTYNHPRPPLKPTLASNRTAKTPLTPRLAAVPTTTTSIATANTTSTSTSTASHALRSGNGTVSRATVATQDNVTPVKPFLNNNITPRSSSRKSRVGTDGNSPGHSPNITPSVSRPTSSIDSYKDPGVAYHGLTAVASISAQNATRPRSLPAQHGLITTPSPRLPPSNLYNNTSLDVPGRETSSLFFHADDAKAAAPDPQPTQKKAPVFFYANGRKDEAPRKQAFSSPPLSSLGKPQAEGKFFHADSLAEHKDRTPVLTPPPVTSSPELLPPHNSTLGPRAPSPIKEWSHLSYRKGASQVIRPALITRNSAIASFPSPGTVDVPDYSRRRSSVASSVARQGHYKSASLSSIDSVTELLKSANDTSVMTSSPLHTDRRQFSNMSLCESVASIPSPLVTSSGLPSPAPLSPVRGVDGQSALEHMNELAANARRERKVLDLEISNSSLLAINRSLEKEVRKQKVELRRLRRMSRAGLSTFDVTGSSIETFSATAGHRADLSDMSEEEEEEPEEPEEPEESSDSSADEKTLDADAQAEREEAQRLRDEKRLQLDLSKHRELLLDSQKMNQSLKKCLGWTEQLIKDGQKALDYNVQISDVNLGGRVLIHEDDHDATKTEESKGLLSPWSPLHHTIDILDPPFFPKSDAHSGCDSGADSNSGHLETPAYLARTPELEFRPRVPGRWESYTTAAAPAEREDRAPLDSPFEERIRHLHAAIDALEAS